MCGECNFPMDDWTAKKEKSHEDFMNELHQKYYSQTEIGTDINEAENKKKIYDDFKKFLDDYIKYNKANPYLDALTKEAQEMKLGYNQED